jgi:myo-inositol-1(or 4)-monophosphatase
MEASINDAKLTINTLHSIREKKIYNYLLNYKGFFKVTGVDALNFCLIAQGKYDVLIESGLKIVDIFPIRLILENAGAILTDWNGGTKFEKGRVLVSPNKKIHNFYLNILKNL